MNKITILGSGTSTGVPILGCNCRVCQSTDPRNKRLRTSALIQTHEQKNILIDASPDLRTQLLRESIQSIDAVIITHDHADHTHGMDDLRPYGFKQQMTIPVYSDSTAARDLRRKFQYIFQKESYFQDKAVLGGGIPQLDLHEIAAGIQRIAGAELEIFSLPHGHEETLMFRHQGMAYITDCREIPQAILEPLRDAQLELLLIDCLRIKPHQTHLHLDQTLKYIDFIRPQKAVLIHMGHELDYLDLLGELSARGAKNVFPGIDSSSFLYS